MTKLGFDQPLYILPLDHRRSLQTKLFGRPRKPTGRADGANRRVQIRHQPFLHTTLQRVRMVHRMIDLLKNQLCDLEVDGGIEYTTAPSRLRQGLAFWSPGRAVFGDPEGVAA